MITLTREEAQQVLDAMEYHVAQTRPITRTQETIETLRAALAQPERAECDGGQCGIGGYCKQCPKPQQSWCMAMNKCENKCEDCPDKPEPEPVVKLKELLEVQGRNGTWNYDPYFHGMYNGMEVMLAVLEDREPVFRGAPEKWLSKKEWQGLTDEEVKILATQGRTDFSRPAYNEFYSAIEQVLKEKNNG